MSTLTSVQSFVTKNSSKILLILGIGGVVASNVLSVKNTPTALKLIERKKEELDVEFLTPVETIKATWKCYIVPASILLSSIGCLVGAHVTDARRFARLSAAYALSEDIFREYRNKVIETVGEEKEAEIQKDVDQRVSDTLSGNSVDLSGACLGDVPCLDIYSKGVFWSTKEKIGAIVNKLNFKMLNENYISVDDYCFELGTHPDPDYGDSFGWNVNDGYLEPRFSVYELNNEFVHGRPVLKVELSRKPDRDYDNMH